MSHTSHAPPVASNVSTSRDDDDKTEVDKNKDFDIDPSTGRKVPHKRANEAYLVHQRWLEKQARIEERKKYLRENRPLPPELREAEKPDFSPLANFLFSMIVAAFFSVLMFLLAGLFIQGDLLWGYRGKWTNWHRYVPVC